MRRVWPRLSLVMALGLPMVAMGQADRVTGFSFLRLDPSARSASMAGSFLAVFDDDVNSFFYNPALLNEQMTGAISLSYLNHVADINAGFLSYARHLEGKGTLGAGIRFLSWGSFDRANEFGERDGTFSARDIALTVGAGRSYNERIRYGMNLHIVYSTIESVRASALAVDAGVAYVVAESELIASASLNHLGVTTSSFGETRDELPLDLRVGVSKKLAHLPLMLSVTAFDLHNIGDPPNDASGVGAVFQYLALGGEFQFSPAFRVRLGYNHRKHDALKQKSRLDLAGLGIGVGIMIRKIRFDYSYNSWSSLGGLNQLTLGTVL